MGEINAYGRAKSVACLIELLGYILERISMFSEIGRT